MIAATFALVALLPGVLAQGTVWSQCGGIGWTGSTACVSGTTCVEVNDWYFQCQPTGSPTTSVPSSTTSGGTSPTSALKPNYWFSFGDSYTQTFFSSTGALPNPQNVFGNPSYPGFTIDGTPNWIDYVATQYNRSLVYTYNYAWGGATIDSDLVAPYSPSVHSIIDQVTEFLNYAGKKPAATPWTSQNSLFSVFVGINDLTGSFWQSGDRDAAVGARNFFFITVPPVDRSPQVLALATETQAALKKVIEMHNGKIASRAASFKASHAGVQTYVHDSYVIYSEILNKPASYGFKNITGTGAGPGYFWYDGIHPNTQVHKIVAQEIGQKTLGGTVW